MRHAEDLSGIIILSTGNRYPVLRLERLVENFPVHPFGKPNGRYRVRRKFGEEAEADSRNPCTNRRREPFVAPPDVFNPLCLQHLKRDIDSHNERDGRSPRRVVLLV